MEVIAVSGTPGTGKTTLAKKLAKNLDFYYLDVNKFINTKKLYESYDKKRRTKIVDVNKLNKSLINKIKSIKKQPLTQKFNKKIQFKNKTIKNKGLIIDSHISHYLPRRYVDICIITKCDIKKLNKRLKKKRFSKNKINENLQAEIFDICYNEAVQKKHKVIAVDTTKGFNIDKIAKQLGG